MQYRLQDPQDLSTTVAIKSTDLTTLLVIYYYLLFYMMYSGDFFVYSLKRVGYRKRLPILTGDTLHSPVPQPSPLVTFLYSIL